MKKTITIRARMKIAEAIIWLVGWFNATFNNISDISWRSVLLVEETGVPRRELCEKCL